MIIVMMGICGTGKSTLGKLLAGRLDVPFVEGDDYHLPEAVAKMAKGEPLTDADRWPWLDRLSAAMGEWSAKGEAAVVSCSALRRAYRDRLRAAAPDVVFVYLEGGVDLVRTRMAGREGHFMPVALVDSQIADLEDPRGEPGVVSVSIEGSPDEIVTRIEGALKKQD
ncbi:gluconokinase [Rhodobium orientis]|uniref:Gluconokinase n=1 Tax=Rhodobium orientis TaxID=34017 RepID=A0A327JTB5_9HYPH|nr:gluconokinase [Rhodobium orientis]MBK5952050.1 gluconate kinase [Rhodobium orientis]RAI26548.1 gluconate kinase [Rhodobium orientis]